MISPLRSRRRSQTARDIQMATIRLANAHGLEAVTTEMISAEAGISPRTFFNYYPNKEAAVIGHPPSFGEVEAAAFVGKAGSFSEDFGRLMQTLIAGLEADRPVLAAAAGLGQQNPRLLALHETSMRELKDRLVAILAARLPEEDPLVLRLLALSALEAVRLAIDRWLAGDEAGPAQSVAALWPQLARAGALLAEAEARQPGLR